MFYIVYKNYACQRYFKTVVHAACTTITKWNLNIFMLVVVVAKAIYQAKSQKKQTKQNFSAKSECRSISVISISIFSNIKTHGSELRGQVRAKRLPKTKRTTNYCESFTRANVFII